MQGREGAAYQRKRQEDCHARGRERRDAQGNRDCADHPEGDREAATEFESHLPMVTDGVARVYAVLNTCQQRHITLGLAVSVRP